MMVCEKKILIKIRAFVLALNILFALGCAHYSNRVAVGMLGGAVAGAMIGNQFNDNGEKQNHTQNVIVSSMVMALVTGGALSWHYQKIEEVKTEISGRYARYRLCDPEDLPISLIKQLESGSEDQGLIFKIPQTYIGKSALTLDDKTKWIYPIFRKRFLQPERGEMQVLSERYIWEIIKSGRFVTRSQDPQYFIEP